jgi:ATP-binding cassette subfamily A (ABC1) protein 3
MGSSLFLKGIFGIGYTLIITHNQLDLSNINAEQNEISRKDLITNLVKKYINWAEILSSVGNEQSFRLPFSSSNVFPAMFNEFDKRKIELKITEYSISVTTLDEVFMLAGGSTANHQEAHSSKRISSSNIISNDSNNEEQGNKLTINDKTNVEGKDDDDDNEIDKYIFFKHFKAQLNKRIIYGGRDKNLLICQLILPVLIVILGLSLLLLKPSLQQPNLLLDASKYNTDLNKKYSNFVPFHIDYSMGSSIDNDVSNSLLNDMMTRFNGDATDGIDGISVGITNGDIDMFHDCTQGAAPLYNMSNYLLQDQESSEKGSTRYGAVTLSSLTNLSNLVYNVMVNASSNHGVGIYVNELHNSYLQATIGILTANIKINNHPLPPTYNEEHIDSTISAFVVSLFCMIAFCFIPSNFVTFIVKEREVKAKHQQLISGKDGIFNYWSYD